MHKIIGEWRAPTDPVENRFLHDLLESMQVDLAAAAVEAGGSDAASDAAELGVPGSGEDDGGLVCGSPIFFLLCIFFN